MADRKCSRCFNPVKGHKGQCGDRCTEEINTLPGTANIFGATPRTDIIDGATPGTDTIDGATRETDSIDGATPNVVKTASAENAVKHEPRDEWSLPLPARDPPPSKDKSIDELSRMNIAIFYLGCILLTGRCKT